MLFDRNTKTIRKWMLGNPISLVVILLILCMGLFIQNFFTARNFLAILQQVSSIGIAAVGLTFAIISGGNDLSVGSIMAFSGVVAGLTMQAFTGYAELTSTLVALLAGLYVGCFIGLLNGVMIVQVGINAFIMTLIMQMLVEGLGIFITSANAVSGFTKMFIRIGTGSAFGIPYSIYIFIAIVLLSHFALSRTVFGRRVYSVGASIQVSRLVGLSVAKTRILCFLISGVSASVSGLLMTSRIGAATAGMGSYIFLDIMSAVIIGGTSLFGGKGNQGGTFFGVLLIGLISNGLNLLSADYNVTLVVKGSIILIAITIEVIRMRIQGSTVGSRIKCLVRKAAA